MKQNRDGQIKAYFLGKMAPAEAESFEEECAASAVLTEQAQLIERELTDDYLHGDLSAEDVRLFEDNYLTSEARRTKLGVARALRQISAEERKSAGVSFLRSFRQRVTGGQKGLRLAFCGLILFLIFGAIAFYLSSFDIDGNEPAAIEIAKQPAKIENPLIETPETENQTTPAGYPAVQDEEDDTGINSTEKKQAEPKTFSIPKDGRRNPSSLAVFTLLPGTLRDEGEQFITIAPETKNLRLYLKLPADANRYQTFRAVLKPVEDETIYTAPNLKSLNFTIAAEKLENRTYILFLEGKNKHNEFESVTEYSFRVRR